jgi:hypothetical protein
MAIARDPVLNQANETQRNAASDSQLTLYRCDLISLMPESSCCLTARDHQNAAVTSTFSPQVSMPSRKITGINRFYATILVASASGFTLA